MSSSRYRPGGGDDVAGFVGMALFLAALLIGVSVYYAFRAIWLVIQVSMRHPRNRALWIAFGVCLGAWSLLGLTAAVVAIGGHVGAGRPSETSETMVALAGTLLCLAVVATAALVLTAKIIDLREDALFQREMTKETLVDDVLHHPWWEAA